MSATAVQHAIQDYLQVLSELGPFDDFFTDDIVFSIVGTDQVAHGRQAAAQMIRYVHSAAFEVKLGIGKVVCDASGAAAELRFVGTHIGDFAGVPATGKHVDVSYCAVYDLRDDRITAIRAYFPLAILLQQIT